MKVFITEGAGDKGFLKIQEIEEKNFK